MEVWLRNLDLGTSITKVVWLTDYIADVDKFLKERNFDEKGIFVFILERGKIWRFVLLKN